MAAKILIINEICNYFMLTLLKDRVMNGCFMTKDRVINGHFMIKDRVMKGHFMTKDRVIKGRFMTKDRVIMPETEERGIVSCIRFLLWTLMLSQDDNI